MFDALIGLDEGDDLTLKFAGGELFLVHKGDQVWLTLNADTQVFELKFDPETLEVISNVGRQTH